MCRAPPASFLNYFFFLIFFFSPIQTSGRLDAWLPPPTPPKHRDLSMLLPSYTLTSPQVIIKEFLSKPLSPTETRRLSFIIDYIGHTHGHALCGGAACELLSIWRTLHTLSWTFHHFFLELKGFFRDAFLQTLPNPPKEEVPRAKGDWQLLRCTHLGFGHTSELCPIVTLWVSLKIRDREGKKSLTSVGEYLSIRKTSNFF